MKNYWQIGEFKIEIAIPVGEWSHETVTYDGTTVTIYCGPDHTGIGVDVPKGKPFTIERWSKI